MYIYIYIYMPSPLATLLPNLPYTTIPNTDRRWCTRTRWSWTGQPCSAGRSGSPLPRIYVHMCVYKYMCVYMYIRRCIHIYVHIYTYICGHDSSTTTGAGTSKRAGHGPADPAPRGALAALLPRRGLPSRGAVGPTPQAGRAGCFESVYTCAHIVQIYMY